MITLADSLQLAYTKIRTRRIRLFVVLFVSSLLFSILVAGSLIVTGALDSFRAFSQEGFTDRYIVAGQYQDSDTYNNGGSGGDPAVIARAEALQKDLETRKKAEAKRLGIEYVADDTDKAVYDDGNGGKTLNTQSSIGRQVVEEFDASNPQKVDLNRFKQQVPGADTYYQAVTVSNGFGGGTKPALNIVADGKEQEPQKIMSYSPGMTKGLAGLSDSWTLMDDELLQPFVLKGQSLKMQDDGVVPIIASYSAAQEVLKLPVLSVKATGQEKKARLIDVRERIAGKTFTICYRNASSANDLQAAIQQQADLKANQGKKDYQKPDYITAPSSEPCKAPVVQRDARSAEEKQLAQKQASFDRTFGKVDPVSQLITYRIVGVSPDRTIPVGMSVNDILSSVLASSIGANWASPMQVREKLPVSEDIFKVSAADQTLIPQQTYFAEFHEASTARTALKEKTCVLTYPGMTLEEGQISCSRKTNPFYLQTFGSASIAVDEFQVLFRKFQLVAAAVIGVIAAVILMGMVGRIIADARKETAVFRALGASRLSVSQIYVTYTIYVALITVIIALLLGFGLAVWVDNSLSPDTSVTMALLFNTSDLSRQFHFYGLDFYDVGLIAVAIIGASVLGSLIPIAHNVQRNPIRDMREE